ncbi:hypothetical protein CI238_08337 [Colletotrichum incanum]|uniref:Uncharacterized protein n=1 Tax=Colletotrichum incanum TaxID=1573173 RepID=A0A167AXB7_COLIC|nr:hypothetical protein CI238_08337 [Colletotrichum incanum]OHW97910.1 hypothetical protein CSPAE12_03280 [Colletotrichum incanum]
MDSVMSTFRAASSGHGSCNRFADLLGDFDDAKLTTTASRPSSRNSRHPLRPHRGLICPRRTPMYRPAHRLPLVFLTAFTMSLFMEVRLHSMYIAHGDLLNERGRMTLVVVTATAYILNGMALLGGCFVSGLRAWRRLLEGVSWGDCGDSEEETHLPVSGGAREREAEEDIGCAGRCVSEKAIKRLLKIEVGVFLVALWPLALAWVVVLWVRDGVGCGNPEETVCSAAATQEQGSFSAVVNERTSLLEGLIEAYKPKDEDLSEVIMELRQVEVERNRQAYAMLMGQESTCGN